MKALTTIATLLFYFQHLIVMVLVVLLNFIKYSLKFITGRNSEKQPLLPHEVTHQHVFSHICKTISMKMTSFQMKVIH